DAGGGRGGGGVHPVAGDGEMADVRVRGRAVRAADACGGRLGGASAVEGGFRGREGGFRGATTRPAAGEWLIQPFGRLSFRPRSLRGDRTRKRRFRGPFPPRTRRSPMIASLPGLPLELPRLPLPLAADDPLLHIVDHWHHTEAGTPIISNHIIMMIIAALLLLA